MNGRKKGKGKGQHEERNRERKQKGRERETSRKDRKGKEGNGQRGGRKGEGKEMKTKRKRRERGHTFFWWPQGKHRPTEGMNPPKVLDCFDNFTFQLYLLMNALPNKLKIFAASDINPFVYKFLRCRITV